MEWTIGSTFGRLLVLGTVFFTGWLLAGCPAPPPRRDGMNLPNFSGVVQKGPFLQGTVQAWSLDGRFSPAGWPGEGWVSSPGEYWVDYDFADGPALIEARGTYFHLLTGLDLLQEVSLRAVAEVAPSVRINVNVLTTLAEKRIRTLAFVHELPYEVAKAQAEREVLAAFGLPSEGVGPFETLDISGDGDGDAMLLAVTAVLLGGGVPPEVDGLQALAEDLAPDGMLAPDWQEGFYSASRSLKCHTVRENLLRFWAERVHRPGAVVPLFEAWIDSDGDGRLNKDQDPSVISVMDGYRLLPDRLPLRLQFDAPMVPPSLMLGGELAASVGEVAWSSTRFSNDTLTLHPDTAWPAGTGRTLVVSIPSVFGRRLNAYTLSPEVIRDYTVYSGPAFDMAPTAAAPTRDGGLAFVAGPDASGLRNVLVRLDENLDVTLEATLTMKFEVSSLFEDDDGGFYLVGLIDGQTRVARIAADGASLWVRNRVDLIVSAVAPDPEGGALVCGHALTDPTGNQRLVLWRLDNMGRDVSLCELDGSRRDVCTDLLWTGEDYLVTARTTSPEYGAGDDTTHGRVIRTDALCQVRWQTGLGGSLNDSIEWASSMPDGGFILGGVTSSMDVPGLPPPEDGTFPNGFVVR
ncbi:hypothetical protein KKD52_04155, partial [Myxococcota bacterium]|nr:hypothetical protein [Myxococcota bacterium]MBU1412084.1 hypothetical protein [Myxococcota bacterium]MBU1509535.1 hypothetical protein [Myxococcota bacterium]